MVGPPLAASSFADMAHTAADLTTVVAAVVLGTWAYIRSYGQQIARPAIELSVNATVIGEVASRSLLHVTLNVRNAGSRECRVFLVWKLSSLSADLANLADISYQDSRTREDVTLVGQVRFARQVPRQRMRRSGDDDGPQHPARSKTRDTQPAVTQFGVAPHNYEPVLPYETFVGPGVSQRYEFVAGVPADSAAAAIVCHIQYRRSRSLAETVLAGPVRAVVGLTAGETKVTTFDHTTAGYVAIAPDSPPTRRESQR
jgi:hypothetical protein